VDNRIASIRQIIKDGLADPALQPGFALFIEHSILSGSVESNEKVEGLFRWALLPGLCCQSAGGEASSADYFSAAWFLFYAAAYLMDKVQDGDLPEKEGQPANPGLILSASTGLFFLAAKILHRLSSEYSTQQAAPEITTQFYSALLTMGGGQFLDLTTSQRNLSKYWEIAAAKSGAFFQLACWGGARITLQRQDLLTNYSNFGRNLGILIQILDDLEDYKNIKASQSSNFWSSLENTLPVVYANEVLSPEQAQDLISLIRSTEKSESQIDHMITILDNSGSGLYLLAEIDRYIKAAEISLEGMGAYSTANKELRGMLDRLIKRNADY
jgi:hypothetical protein